MLHGSESSFADYYLSIDDDIQLGVASHAAICLCKAHKYTRGREICTQRLPLNEAFLVQKHIKAHFAFSETSLTSSIL